MSNKFGNKKLNAIDSYLIIKARYIYTDDDDKKTYYYFFGGGPADISEKIYMSSAESMKKILKNLSEASADNKDSSYQLTEMDVFTSLSDADLKKTIPEWVATATGIIKQENDLYRKNHDMDGKLRILFKYKKDCSTKTVYVNLLNRKEVGESDIVLEL